MSGDTPDARAAGHFVKAGRGARHAARLLREADLLSLAPVPGTVRLLARDGTENDPILVTARVDGSDLRRVPDLAVEEVAGLVAALGTTLADLHDLGVVHGAVMAEHVLLSSEGRPILCGFGYGARTGERPVAEAPLPEAAVDPARTPGAPLAPASDVLALGALLDSLLATATPAGLDANQVDALRAVVGRTAAADAQLRPSARAVAEAVRHAVPSARLPAPAPLGGSSTAPDTEAAADQVLRTLRRGRGNALPLGRRDRRPKAVVVASAAAVTALAFVAVLGRGTPERPARSRPSARPVSPPWTASAAVPASLGPGPTPTTSGTPPRPCPPLSGSLAADTDGDGCPDALRWERGVVEAGDRRWAVGQPGDLVVTGDWRCTGTATLAVLRPGTGQVFVFDGWAAKGKDLTAPQAARVEGGFALRAAELDGDSCADLVVERAGGPPATVPLDVRGP